WEALEPKHLGAGEPRQEEHGRDHGERGHEERPSGAASMHRGAGANHKPDESRRDDRLHEPSGAEETLGRPQHEDEDTESQIVEDGAHEAEDEHESPNE